ncbi:unnamed protein product [Linum tenue]|uniref:Uncharacterized protein n=1 Tax=Linum tenue TaxID=586396 RepID=A0AAV0IL37_9ROSI|nr:unnamed protein product [Linum tenue]
MSESRPQQPIASQKPGSQPVNNTSLSPANFATVPSEVNSSDSDATVFANTPAVADTPAVSNTPAGESSTSSAAGPAGESSTSSAAGPARKVERYTLLRWQPPALYPRIVGKMSCSLQRRPQQSTPPTRRHQNPPSAASSQSNRPSAAGPAGESSTSSAAGPARKVERYTLPRWQPPALYPRIVGKMSCSLPRRPQQSTPPTRRHQNPPSAASSQSNRPSAAAVDGPISGSGNIPLQNSVAPTNRSKLQRYKLPPLHPRQPPLPPANLRRPPAHRNRPKHQLQLIVHGSETRGICILSKFCLQLKDGNLPKRAKYSPALANEDRLVIGCDGIPQLRGTLKDHARTDDVAGTGSSMTGSTEGPSLAVEGQHNAGAETTKMTKDLPSLLDSVGEEEHPREGEQHAGAGLVNMDISLEVEVQQHAGAETTNTTKDLPSLLDSIREEEPPLEGQQHAGAELVDMDISLEVKVQQHAGAETTNTTKDLLSLLDSVREEEPSLEGQQRAGAELVDMDLSPEEEGQQHAGAETTKTTKDLLSLLDSVREEEPPLEGQQHAGAELVDTDLHL